MKVAIVGSRDLVVDDLENYLPENITEIISGGARGIDCCARDYAIKNSIKLTEFYPQYEKYGRKAPLMSNDKIIYRADLVIAFWNGKSHGTKYVISKCQEIGKSLKVYYIT